LGPVEETRLCIGRGLDTSGWSRHAAAFRWREGWPRFVLLVVWMIALALVDEKTLHHLASVRERLAAAEEYERIHGKDALLVKEHPWNIRNAEMLPRLRERWRQKRDVAGQPSAT
jgi:hypothetical protein